LKKFKIRYNCWRFLSFFVVNIYVQENDSLKGILKPHSENFFKSSGFVLLISALYLTLLICSWFWIYGVNVNISNSDLIYLESLYRDIFVRHYPLSGWLVSKAPFFFPDWVMYFLLRALSGSYFIAWYSYTIINFGLLLTFLFGVLNIFHPKQKKSSFLFAICWGSILILLLPFTPPGYGRHIFVIPVAHSGALLNSLLICWVWLLSLTKPMKWKGLLFLFLFCIIATMSDEWWIMWAGFPIGLTTLLLIMYKKVTWRNNFPLLFSLGLGVILGELFKKIIEIQKWLFFSHTPVGTAGSSILNQFYLISRDLFQLLKASPLLLILLIITLIFCFFIIRSWGYPAKWRANSASIPQNKNTCFVAFHIAIILSFIIPFFLIIPFKLWEQWNYRYIYPLLFFPWIIVGLHLFHFRHKLKLFSLVYIFPIILFLSLYIAQLTFPQKQYFGFMIKAPEYTSSIACLDEVARAHHLKFGLGEYFHAKQLTEISRANVWINQITYNYDIYFWMNNFYWYLNPSSHHELTQYDFVVAVPSDQSWQKLQSTVGSPSEINVCGDLGVFIYKGKKRELFNSAIYNHFKVFFEDMIPNYFAAPNLIHNGDFSSPIGNEWYDATMQKPSNLQQKQFHKAKNFSGKKLYYYARWTVNQPVNYDYLEQRINNINQLTNKKLALTFWARSLLGNRSSFASTGYFVPQGILNKTAIPFHEVPIVLNHHWQKFTADFYTPNFEKQKIASNGYVAIRPLFYQNSSQSQQIDIADVQLTVSDSTGSDTLGIISEKESHNYKAIEVNDIPDLIAKADQAHKAGNFNEEYKLLKAAETATPLIATQLVEFTRKAPAPISKKLLAQLYWRLARAECGFAKGKETIGHLELAEWYTAQAYKLQPENPKFIKWYAVTHLRFSKTNELRDEIIAAKMFSDLITEAIKLEPKNAELYALMGKWNYNWAKINTLKKIKLFFLFLSPPHGSYTQAENYFEKAIKLDPKNSRYQQWLAKIRKKDLGK